MKFLLIFMLAVLLVLPSLVCAQETARPLTDQLTEEKPSDVIEFFNRFSSPENSNILQAAMWTVTHDYEEYENLTEILNTFHSYFQAFSKYEKNDRTQLEKLGGIGSFKDKNAEWLTDEDQAIRAFAAVVLGVSGDRKYAPNIAALLKERKYKIGPQISYDRGKAAISLGLLGAKEYLPELIPLLSSKNEYDRQGAISALGYFGAKEYANEVASILINEDFRFSDDPTPIYFLVETKTAIDYKKELVAAMLGEFRSETSKAAMYALVSLNAKETASDIATLLNDRFKRGDAAKALALLNAKEYTEKIARLLGDESGLVRSDAAIALGVMQTQEFAANVVKLLSCDEGYVRTYAATSLLLMEASEYYKAALPFVKNPVSSRTYLANFAFHPLVADQARLIAERLERNYQVAKSMQ